MRLSVGRGPLLDALRGVQRAISRKEMLPILSSALIEGRDGRATVHGTDMNVYTSCSVLADVLEPGSIAAPAAALATLIAELHSEATVTLQGTSKLELHVGVVDADFRAKIACCDPVEYPRPADLGDLLATATMSQEDLRRILDGVAFAVSGDQTRLSLNGVLWERNRRHLVGVATDGHRLSKWTFSEVRMDPTDPAAEERIAQWIVPPRALDAVLPLCGSQISVDLFKHDLRFRSTTEGSIVEVAAIARTIEGPYPAYQQVLPRSTTHQATLDLATMIQTVRRVSTLSSKSTRQIRLSFHSGLLHVSAVNLDLGGEGSDSMAATWLSEAPEYSIGVNAGYLLEILKLVPAPEVRLRFNTPTQAIVIEPFLGEDKKPPVTFILMPLRLSE